MQVAYFGGLSGWTKAKSNTAADPPFGPDDLQAGDKKDSAAYLAPLTWLVFVECE